MTEHQYTKKTRHLAFSEYEQQYLDCLEHRRPQLESILRGRGFPLQAARDAAQEAITQAAMLVVQHTVESLQDRWAWLRTVAIHKAHTNARNRWNRRVPLAFDALATGPSADEEQNNWHDAVHSALDHLTPHLKELVVYCYMQEHTYAEAAERFQIGLGVVSRRLREARDQLRSELNPLFRARAGESV